MKAPIELRSDTFTKPTPGMRAAMASAEVGDDVFGEDPTVNRLEAKVAELLGKEAAVFVPSGTMSNQACLRAHTQPGDEIICDVNCHIYNYEAGGPAVLSGLMCRTVEGEDGIMDLSQLRGLVRPINDHMVRTRVVCLENTHNRGGGKIYPYEKVVEISAWARKQGLIMHLDGARLANAVVASRIPFKQWTQHFDSVSICFSKGLGAPVGSALAGPPEFVKRARRCRKLFGGSMRQAGILAAAAIYALDNHVERLKEDHDNAQVLAQAISDSSNVTLYPETIDTNIVYIVVDPEVSTAAHVAKMLAEHGVMALPTAPHKVRMCTHLDVSAAQAERAADVIRKVLRKLAPVPA